MSNQLIGFYHTKFKLSADDTMKKVKLINKVLEGDDIHTLKRDSMLPLSQQRKRINRLIEGEDDNPSQQHTETTMDVKGALANSTTLSNPL